MSLNDEFGRADNRLECLKLAQAAEDTGTVPRYTSATAVLQRAREYADFVNGYGGTDAEDTPV